ncbi:hypothetical protein OH77DRAFT_1387313, partial [Trametes cingulata]
MHSGQTGQRLGMIPLVLGMPVIISQNFDVGGGVVNGSIGTLTKVRYKVEAATGRRMLSSCVVRLSGLNAKPMTMLDDDEVPILEDTI